MISTYNISIPVMDRSPTASLSSCCILHARVYIYTSLYIYYTIYNTYIGTYIYSIFFTEADNRIIANGFSLL